MRQNCSSCKWQRCQKQCGINQLCTGLEGGIEGGIHAVSELWSQCEAGEEWGFLLIDAASQCIQ
jgi:hypothetical protein